MGEWEPRAARTQQRATRFDTQLERDGISQLVTMQITWMKDIFDNVKVGLHLGKCMYFFQALKHDIMSQGSKRVMEILDV